MKSQSIINVLIALVGVALGMVGIGIDKILPGVSGYWFLIPGIILFIVGVTGIVKLIYSKRKNKYHTILLEIEKSRKEAVALHIEGMQFSDERALDYWIQRVGEWKKSILDKLFKFNPTEAGKFDTLGNFSAEFATGTTILNGKHEQILSILIRRMKILEEIRDRWIKLHHES